MTGRIPAVGVAAGGSAATVVISAIGGMARVGKTALAIQFAHQAAARFPYGQLYVNLRCFVHGFLSITPQPARITTRNVFGN